MGRTPKKFELACVQCGVRRQLDRYAARAAGWELWLGGGRCPTCSAPLTPAPVPDPMFAPPSYTEHVIVGCQGCGRESESTQEYVDGWRPGIHWTKDPEQIQKSRESVARRVRDPRATVFPLPLCPGWDKPALVVRVERREVAP